MRTDAFTNATSGSVASESPTAATEDSMSISFVNVPSPIDENVPTLRIATFPKHDVIGLASELTKTQVCVNMKARDLPDDDTQRAPVDIIVALDVSGSMNGLKLNLCKKTLLLLLRVLYPDDRFGLVCYAENATIDIPVQKMTEANKKQCVEKIETLRTRGCTNMSSAIGLARQEMHQILKPNEVQTVFLLTDGHANAGIRGNGLVEFTRNCFVGDDLTLDSMEGAEDQVTVQRGTKNKWFQRCSTRPKNDDNSKPAAINPTKPGRLNPITMHCFGVGSDHDADLLQKMSDVVPGGSYYYIENDVDVGSAFGDALGGILSVVAQSVVVTISVPEEAKAKGVKIVDVFHEHKVKRDNGTYTVVVGDAYAEEVRDVVFEVQLANCGGRDNKPVVHAEVAVSYTDTIRKAPACANGTTCVIARPPGSETSGRNHHVEVQWARLLATQAMQQADQMARANNYDGASACIRRAQASVRGTMLSTPAPYQSSLASLDCDMTALSAGMTSASAYKAEGVYKSKAAFASHTKQRAMKAAPATAGNPDAYSSKRKTMMKSKFTTS